MKKFYKRQIRPIQKPLKKSLKYSIWTYLVLKYVVGAIHP